MYQYVYVEGPWEGTQELFLGINKQQPCPKPPPSPKPGNQAVYISKHLKGQLGMKSAKKWNKSKYISDLTNCSLLIAE